MFRTRVLSLGLWIAVGAGCGAQKSSPAPTPLPPPNSTAAASPTSSASAPILPSSGDAPTQPQPSASAWAPAGPPPLAGFVAIPAQREGKFPGTAAAKARMFDASAQCTRAVGDDGRLCVGAAQPGAELNALQLERLTLLLNDQRAFGRATPTCSTPDHAVVFYDKADLPIAEVSVGLACSSVAARPQLNGIAKSNDATMLTATALSYVRGVCKQLKLSGCDAKPAAKPGP